MLNNDSTMIKKRTATTAMLELRMEKKSAKGADNSGSVISIRRTVVRSNRVLITDRRDMPLVSPVKVVKVTKMK